MPIFFNFFVQTHESECQYKNRTAANHMSCIDLILHATLSFILCYVSFASQNINIITKKHINFQQGRQQCQTLLFVGKNVITIKYCT